MEQLKVGKPFVFYIKGVKIRPVETKAGKEYYVDGPISTSDLDLVKDIVTEGCLDNIDSQLKSRAIKLDYEHEAFKAETTEEAISTRTRMPLGKAVDHNRSNGSWVSFHLNKAWKKFDSDGKVTMNFTELLSSIKSKFLDAFSIAFIPVRFSYKNINGDRVRMLEEILLLNVALTGNPVNPAASMSAVFAKSLKSMPGNRALDKKAYEKDGAHAHTDEGPLGEHNHPEIEKAFSGIWDAIFRNSDSISELSAGVADSGLKYHSPKDKKKKKKKGDKPMTEEKPTGEGEENNAPDSENKGNEEVKSLLVELKTLIDAQASDTKALKEELTKNTEENKANAEAIAEINKTLNSARPKQVVADKKTAAEAGMEAKSTGMVGTLDMIGAQ